jgi:hypothetical protein
VLSDDAGIQRTRDEETMDSICCSANKLSLEGIGHHWALLSLRLMPVFHAYAETGLIGMAIKGLDIAMQDVFPFRYGRVRVSSVDMHQERFHYDYSDRPWV